MSQKAIVPLYWLEGEDVERCKVAVLRRLDDDENRGTSAGGTGWVALISREHPSIHRRRRCGHPAQPSDDK